MNDKATWLKRDLALVQSELRQLQGEIDTLYTRHWELGEAKQRKQRDLIREMGLLQKTPWRVRTSNSQPGFYLDGGMDKDQPELAALAAHDWHCSLTLRNIGEHGYIELRFDDGDITLIATSDVTKDEFVEFIKDWQMNITTDGIEESIADLRKKADDLQALVDLF